MTDAKAEVPAKSGAKLLIISTILGVVAAIAGYFAVSKGMIPFPTSHEDTQSTDHGSVSHSAPLDVAFVEVPPLLVPMGNLLSNQYLRFRTELEVDPKHQSEVTALIPRIVDVLNGYLRALDREDLEKPSALILLRSNLLRRVQAVAGRDKVKNLLIMEFVVN